LCEASHLVHELIRSPGQKRCDLAAWPWIAKSITEVAAESRDFADPIIAARPNRLHVDRVSCLWLIFSVCSLSMVKVLSSSLDLLRMVQTPPRPRLDCKREARPGV
jgi:hypothetical protein